MPPGFKPIPSVHKQVRRLSDAALDLLFPPRCVVCGTPGMELCEACRSALPRLQPPLCERCALPLAEGTCCPRCSEHSPAFRRVRSAYAYEGAMRRAILALKYGRRRRLAAPLVDALTAALQRPDPTAIALCPVPMHHTRELERGYNHAKLLADELGQRWELPVLPADALARTRQTTTQVGLDYHTRLANVKGAFEADRRLIEGRVVLLVDDVCTTGATLNACAGVLLTAGAAAVEGVTVARTL